ncbi:hypothetical protein L596_009652 [Steinernema carpocapsae]|uniref:Hexosyltransferase n=1 Tax=Steinernema carpocapsae TaxID=34508 RepID=A0A4U5PFY6_STECR|nr:hypothetical protein L596_009652 [Steinernema carpocapsae]
MRQAIRSTWAHPDNWTHASFFFAMGDPRDVEISKNLEAENEDYGDLIITDLVDSYKNLTLKVHAGLDWFNRFCSEVQFFMKIDDDVALHVDRLLQSLQNANQSIHCAALENRPVNRNEDSAWYVPPKIYAPSTYPTYCAGPSYMIPSEAARVIVEKTSEHPYFFIDDVFYTGIVAEAAGIPMEGNSKVFYTWDGLEDVKCDANGTPLLATMFHFKTPEALFNAYDHLLGISCGQKSWWDRLSGW